MKFPSERRDKTTIEEENKGLTRRAEGLKKQIELNNACINEEEVQKEIDAYRQKLIKKQADADKKTSKK